MDISALKYVDHDVGIDDLLDVCNTRKWIGISFGVGKQSLFYKLTLGAVMDASMADTTS